ncbi:hypothetical protein P168DRAFT_271735 [Aspergillus campestris IBT 28561]|uniref:Uncharacterized protein n=1 Tax=Aspergillus campestris (strain IBT 28561) TaxID=1392248 RepID=A0A2I1CXW1_ASPC2|nr:uncharacterized protein P168DRAFT_271735 [Aspergillus campestris IBT 28561]PKY02469.1 hypothetical protein P168DRAFT_271735 [Aspergillus campestris IBT 28561]
MLDLPRPSSYPTTEEVRQESRDRATQILSTWETLSKIVERHEERIQKRWRQKTQHKRRQILLTAWPNMPEVHRPDFAAFKKGVREQAREAYLWPYINLEDLRRPRPLLLFLNARARNPPHLFAQADFDALRLGRGSSVIRPPFLNLHTMMFAGRTTPETYGELLAWDKNPEAMAWAIGGRGILPGPGLLILEIQQRLYEFLLECCYRIFHDIPRESIIVDFPVQPEPTIKDEGDWQSLVAITADAPYRLPAQLDVRALEDVVDAKRSAAEDHLLALREDPGYFASVVDEYKEHRSEMISDIYGSTHPTLTPWPDRLFWNRVLQNVVAEAYVALETWDTLRTALAYLRRLLSKYQGQLSLTEDLPQDLYEAFVRTRYFLEQFTRGPLDQLKVAVPASPPLRSLFARLPPIRGSTKMQVVYRANRLRSQSQDELLWVMETLWGSSLKVQQAGRKTLMDELDRLVQSDPKNKDLISGRVASIVSDLSVLSECLHQIELFQPWAATFEAGLTDETRKEYAGLVHGWGGFLVSFEGTSLGPLEAPGNLRFYYPVEKRRTRENVELMRSAEANLDAFWRAVDRHMPIKSGMTRQNATYRMLARLSGKLQRTPVWVEPERPRPKTKPSEKDVAENQFELEYRTKKTADSTRPVAAATKKVKARGTPAISEQPPVEPSPPPQTDTQPTFAVDKRSLKVFSTLFFQPSQTAQPGEIAWTDFLHAMSGTAFSVQKLYGSVWQFTPRNLDVERSIQIHEPHPVAKIPYQYARRIGRRLFRAYGWHGGMFGAA